MYTVRVKTAPAIEPIFSDDAAVEALIPSVRQQVEAYLRRALITQTLELHLDAFRDPYAATGQYQFSHANREIYLPRPPLQSVTAIRYRTLAGDEKTLDSDQYRVDTRSEPGRVYPLIAVGWPTDLDTHGAVTIEYVAGYGGSDGDVPDVIREAILSYAKGLASRLSRPGVTSESIDNASRTYEANGGQLPGLTQVMLQPYRVMM